MTYKTRNSRISAIYKLIVTAVFTFVTVIYFTVIGFNVTYSKLGLCSLMMALSCRNTWQ
jgi:hypothetical protein